VVVDAHGEPVPVSKIPEAGSINDEMDGLMSDWSWRPRLRDLNPPVYVYSEAERDQYEFLSRFGSAPPPARQPWSFPAYRGLPERPQRIGVTR
jgi:hypothetical protein